METFAEPKELAENPQYEKKRQKILSGLTDAMIDAPIVDIINGFNKLPFCFTMQCCYGHFVCDTQTGPNNFDSLPVTENIEKVEYRIAYIAFCIKNSESGRKFIETLKEVTAVDPENIQFCCAEWFWAKHVNSYALQVEPDRFKRQDTAMLDYEEALRIEKTRDKFFVELKKLLRRQQE